MFRVQVSIFTIISCLVFGAYYASAQQQETKGLADIVSEWLAAPHADYHSRSFTYWNAAGEVPANCAACHSQPGFIDFLGADGSEPMVVGQPAAINAPIGCASCHTAEAHALEAVAFPSGVTVAGLGDSATCTVCHQGRNSTDNVLAAIRNVAEDAVSADLGFINIHYGAAAAVMYGTQTRGGFEYPGKSYAGRFEHVPSANTCTACHDPHTTAVAEDGCLACHRGVENLRDIRTRHLDFDGDGDRTEGIHGEIMTLHARLGEAITVYAKSEIGEQIAYYPYAFPYFFRDLNGDGEIAPKEATSDNRYRSWTPRLLKAAYNYQFVAKDAGGYVHNPAYMLQLLYDSLESLAEKIELNETAAHRP